MELDVLVTDPPHCEDEGAVFTVMPAGRVSVNAIELSALFGLVLCNVKVRVEVPPAPMVTGKKTLSIVGLIAVQLVDWVAFTTMLSISNLDCEFWAPTALTLK